MADPAASGGPVAEVSPRGLPPVTVVLDPADDVSVTRAVLAAHDLAGGRITVHPTPSSATAQAVGCNLLVALGKPLARLAEQKVAGTTPVWQAAAAWIAGEGIRQVIVLRGHELGASAWAKLIELWQRTGVGLVIVCHRERITEPGRAALAGVPHRVTRDLAGVLAALAARTPDYDQRDGPPLPPLPRSEMIRFRADCWRQLSAADFARIDALYTTGITAACRWVVDQPDYRRTRVAHHVLRRVFPAYLPPDATEIAIDLIEGHYPPERLRPLVEGLLCGSDPHRGTAHSPPHPWTDTDGLQLMLSELAAGSPSRRHTLCLVRGAQAGFLLHGLLLDLPAGLDHLPGPGMGPVGFTGDVVARIRAGVAHPVLAAALATALFTGTDHAMIREITLDALSADASALRPRGSRTRRQPITTYFVPAAARPMLRAARIFQTLRGAGPSSRLLGSGISITAFYAAAETCCLLVPAGQGQAEVTPWHQRAACWWVANPLHGNPADDDPADPNEEAVSWPGL